MTKFENPCPRRILLAIIITQHGKFSDKTYDGNIRERANWERGSAELPEGGDDVEEPLQGVSSHSRGKITRTFQLIRCQRKESQRCRDLYSESDSESVTNASTGNRKRCIFSRPGFQGRVYDFIQNLLRLSLACRKIRRKHRNFTLSEKHHAFLPALRNVTIPR